MDYTVNLDKYEINIIKATLSKEIQLDKERYRRYLLSNDHVGADLIQDSITRMKGTVNKLEDILLLNNK